MNRMIIIAKTSEFPRLPAHHYSGAVPDSACGGPAHPDETRSFVPRRDAGRFPARRPGASLLKGVAAVALWDSGKFETSEIAHILDMPESSVADVLHYTREARRARS